MRHLRIVSACCLAPLKWHPVMLQAVIFTKKCWWGKREIKVLTRPKKLQKRGMMCTTCHEVDR